MARPRYAHVVDSVDDSFDEPTAAEPTLLTCVSCGERFEFEAGEAGFFASRGFPPPIRCPHCRQAAKARREARQTA